METKNFDIVKRHPERKIKSESVILIGAPSVGKSTTGKLLAKKLDLGFCDLDDLRKSHYPVNGYDLDYAKKLRKIDFEKLDAYWKPREAQLVVDTFSFLRSPSVLSFGAGQSVYDDEKLFSIVGGVLKGFKNIFLLKPFEDTQKSFELLCERNKELAKPKLGGKPLLQYHLEHPCNEKLATHTFYTGGKTPKEVVQEIFEKLNETKS